MNKQEKRSMLDGTGYGLLLESERQIRLAQQGIERLSRSIESLRASLGVSGSGRGDFGGQNPDTGGRGPGSMSASVDPGSKSQ